MEKGDRHCPATLAELEKARRAGRKLVSLRVTLFPDCTLPLARFRQIDAKLSAYEQVLARMPDLADSAEPQACVESVTWLIAFAGEPEHLQRWVELMLDVDQVDVAEIDT